MSVMSFQRYRSQTPADDCKPSPESSAGSHPTVPGSTHQLESSEENERQQDLDDKIERKVGGGHTREKCDSGDIGSQSTPTFS